MNKRILYISLLAGLMGMVGPVHSFTLGTQAKPPLAKKSEVTAVKAVSSKKSHVKVTPIRSKDKASFVIIVNDIGVMSQLAGFMDDSGVSYSSEADEGTEGEGTPPATGGEGEGEGGGKINCEGWCDDDGDEIPDEDEVGPGAEGDGGRKDGPGTTPASFTDDPNDPNDCPPGVVLC